jgi:imidazole glycerol-phosphate synthase subunit HisH
MTRVAIVDTGLCNLDSIARAVEECGGNPLVTDDPSDLRGATQIVLPGVGAFPVAMAKLTASGLAEEMTEQVVGRGIPFLGICLGMQLMATRGVEIRDSPGLGWIDAEVVPLTPASDERVPHIGWNSVYPTGDSPLFRSIEPGRDFYFVHSFVLEAKQGPDVAATTPYAGGFVSSVGRGQMLGVQFHPEKSQVAGFQVLRNFLAI